MSINRVIQSYQRRILKVEEEPWEKAHDQAIMVWDFEGHVGGVINSLEALIKMDAEIHGHLLKHSPGSAPIKQWESANRKIISLFKQAVPITDDGLRLPLRFNDAEALTSCLGKTVRLRIRLTNATVYGLAFGK